MTLPFRRRHHDDEAWHDRARALFSAGFLGPISEDDQAWLDDHLGRCPYCLAERDAYDADRAMLRGLRDRPLVPPRDLWARIETELERQAPGARAHRGPLGLSLPPLSPRGLPYGPLAGALVALVVLVVALLPPGATPLPNQSPPGSQIAVGSQPPAATPLPVTADRVVWVTATGDGRFSIVSAPVDQVCTEAGQACAPLAASSPAPLELGAPPKAVVMSPSKDQIAVVGADGEAAGSVVIVRVATPAPSATPTASPGGSTLPPTVVPPSASPALPTQSAAGSPGASPTILPSNAGHAIIRGVTIVGDVGYSADGQWFAFSAKPLVGVGGPDLYVWHVGDDQATQLTHDGATFFSGWFDNRIVASSIVAGSSATPSATPDASVTPDASTAATEAPAGSASPPASPGADASAPATREEHPYSFLLEPVSGVRVDFAQPDVWLPMIDPTGRFVAYWSGTVQPADGSTSDGPVSAWRPANGRLVLDGWSAPIVVPEPSPDALGPDVSGQPTSEPPSVNPSPAASEPPAASGDLGSPEPTQAVVADGPVGTPMTLADAPVADFELHFDPTGTRLAIWTADPDDRKIGSLWLVILDPVLGRPVPTVQPLTAPGVVAAPGFSLQEGRLGWVTPPGQDGQPSSVQVLAWSGNEFGQVQTVPGGSLQIVR